MGFTEIVKMEEKEPRAQNKEYDNCGSKTCVHYLHGKKLLRFCF